MLLTCCRPAHTRTFDSFLPRNKTVSSDVHSGTAESALPHSLGTAQSDSCPHSYAAHTLGHAHTHYHTMGGHQCDCNEPICISIQTKLIMVIQLSSKLGPSISEASILWTGGYLMRDFPTGAGACYHDGTRRAWSRVTGKAALVSREV